MVAQRASAQQSASDAAEAEADNNDDADDEDDSSLVFPRNWWVTAELRVAIVKIRADCVKHAFKRIFCCYPNNNIALLLLFFSFTMMAPKTGWSSWS